MENSNEVSNQMSNPPEAIREQVGSTPQQAVESIPDQPPESTPSQKTKKWLTPTLIGIVILALGVIGYFVYQNYQSKQLVSQDNQASTYNSTDDQGFGEFLNRVFTPTSSLTPTPTPTPTAIQSTTIPSPTPTPTANPPDVVVTNGQIRSSNSSLSGTTFEEGSFIYIDFIVTVKNTQPVKTSLVYLKAWVDSNEVRNTGLGNWPANYQRTDVVRTWVDDPGTHKIKVEYNPDHSFSELSYTNNSIESTYTVLPDKEPPTVDIDGPIYKAATTETCMRYINPLDNVSVYEDLKVYTKLDNNTWDLYQQYQCLSGQQGESHIFYVKAVDYRGNTTEKSQQFVLY